MTPPAGGTTNPSPPTEIEQTARRGPRLHRVHDRTTQAKLRRARRVRRGPLTVSRVVESGENPRVAFAVGRNMGGAVHRNRVRRRLRAVMTELAPELVGHAWLVGASPEVLTSDFTTLRASASSAVRHLERA